MGVFVRLGRELSKSGRPVPRETAVLVDLAAREVQACTTLAQGHLKRSFAVKLLGAAEFRRTQLKANQAVEGAINALQLGLQTEAIAQNNEILAEVGHISEIDAKTDEVLELQREMAAQLKALMADAHDSRRSKEQAKEASARALESRLSEELLQLKEMFEAGLLSQDEFGAAKAKVLAW